MESFNTTGKTFFAKGIRMAGRQAGTFQSAKAQETGAEKGS